MEQRKRRNEILMEMTKIETMEKGRLTEEYREKVQDGKSERLGPYYKHQRWEAGRNLSRRVPIGEVEHLREAVEGYHHFQNLADEFVQVTVNMTRSRLSTSGKKKPK